MKKRMLLGMAVLMMGLHAGWAQKSIVILYENDVHCGIDGYQKMAGLRDAINKSDTAYAAVVCCGDCRVILREPSRRDSTSSTS